MLFGAHIPVAGGYDKAARYAAEVGCECMQVFSRSPRMWRTTPLVPDAVAAFSALRNELGLGPLFVHTAYLINLGSADDALWERSTVALAEEITRAAALGATGVVTHIGTRFCEAAEACASRVAEAVVSAFALAGEASGDVGLLLENTAGAGTTFGGEFDELAETIAATGRIDAGVARRVGVCLDTCHAHAHGIDLSSAPGWDDALTSLDASVGIERLGLVHANDSMFASGSHRDRHAWIGDGTIGIEGFRAMVCDPRLAGVPAVTEMPGDPPEKDVTNLTRLKGLRSGCGAAETTLSPA